MILVKYRLPGCPGTGATKYDFQPNDHCSVYADPAGHPFCLSTFQALQAGRNT